MELGLRLRRSRTFADCPNAQVKCTEGPLPRVTGAAIAVDRLAPTNWFAPPGLDDLRDAGQSVQVGRSCQNLSRRRAFSAVSRRY